MHGIRNQSDCATGAVPGNAGERLAAAIVDAADKRFNAERDLRLYRLAQVGIVGERLRDVLPHQVDAFWDTSEKLIEELDATMTITGDDMIQAARKEGFHA